MPRLAIIPARGGSKRIPRKNIKNFLGKPIIAYTIEAALKSKIFEEVMVSTDDEEIAEVAKQYGAKVPFMRSNKNSDGFATTVSVLLEVLAEYKKRGIEYERACCLYPTAPLISPARLKEARNLLIEKELDVVFPVLKFTYPIQRSLSLQDGKVQMNWPENLNARSQDLKAAYHDAGMFYFFTVKSILKNKKLFTYNTGAIVLKDYEAHDIDTVDDWEIAELKYKLLKEIKR
jgi:pseudaminic acid cytidylyltransferase